MVDTKQFWKDDTKITNTVSLSKTGWTEEQIIQYDELALEDHSYIATRGERDRNEKSWVLTLNEEGAQRPMNQRSDFVGSKTRIEKTA